MNSHLTKWEWIFVLAAGWIAALGVLYPASLYGAGVSSDSMFYLSSADNFARGAGFTDFKGDPLIDFPPLYSFILGFLRAISGISSSILGLVLNAAVMALLVVSTGILLRRCFPERRIWFYLGVLLTLVFLPLYTLGANIATDLLYILLTVWFCLAAQSYLENKRFAWLVAMTALAAACAMLRWIGLAVVAAQFLLVFIAYRHDMKKAFLYATVSSGLAFLPAALWIGVHNVWLSGTWGRATLSSQYVDVAGNLRLMGERMLAWTAPNPVTTFVPLVVVFILAILILNRGKDYRRWLTRLIHNPIMPVILVTLIYFVAVTLTGYTGDHLQSFDDRYQAPLYAFILVVLFASLDELVFSHLTGKAYTAVTLLVIAIFGVWGVYRLDLLVTFARTSRGLGVVAYNDYNTQKFFKSGLVDFLKTNPPSAAMTIYTNEPEALYFLLNRLVEMSPANAAGYYADPELLKAQFPSWPKEEEAYLVWFKPNVKRHHYIPGQLEELSLMERLYKARDGEVYLVRPKE